MKKFFLIPLMACFSCVMAWGADQHVSNITDLKAAIANASIETIYLDADIQYAESGNSSCINILRSVTIDGQGHTLAGYGKRGTTSNYPTVAINQGGSNLVDVTLKNLNMTNSKLRVVETRGNIHSLTLENCSIKATASSGYQQPITIGGNQASVAQINITNCHIEGAKYYPIITFNPIELTMTNSSTLGWCAVYFKGIDGSAGSHGSKMVATNCSFDAQNHNKGYSNTFGAIVLEDDGIDVTLDNCQITCTADYPETGADQTAFLLSEWKGLTFNRLQLPMNLEPCNVIIKGASTEIVGRILQDNWVDTEMQCPTTFTVYGGTFNRDISEDFVISEGYEMHVLSTVKDGQPITLYRVTKKAEEKEPGVLYDLNDNVEGDGDGENPVTSFDLSTGTDMTLNNETTTAGYVQVSDNVTTDPDSGEPVIEPTTVTVGKTAEGTDQTLVVNAGLDVQGQSQVVVEPGATLQIGEGGITTSNPENIVIEADENGAASLLLNPEVIVNNTPNLTVKMLAKQIGWIPDEEGKAYFWHRFALPIQQADSWVKNPNKSTYVFGWNYAANDWEQLSALTQMVPFKGYTLTADYEDLGNIEYTFTGQLAGNTNNLLEFERNGFNFFGNSYTGYINVLALVEQLMGDHKIDGTVWMWNQENQSYVAVPLQALRDDPEGFESWEREVAPMQTFILKQNGAENATTELDYASAVWGNPRYGNDNGAVLAPRRAQADETTRMRVIVTAENGKKDFVTLTENAKFSDAYEKGYDGEKYMNEKALNMYTTVNDANYTVVATDNLEGKTVTLKTVESVNYTMSFAKVNGEEYAIRDNATNQVIAIEEGATYEFAAQPNSTIEGRFEIISAKAPTAIENTEVKANVKGIYTIMGQYLGEDFEALPAGIYVINGVKIVK